MSKPVSAEFFLSSDTKEERHRATQRAKIGSRILSCYKTESFLSTIVLE